MPGSDGSSSLLGAVAERFVAPQVRDAMAATGPVEPAWVDPRVEAMRAAEQTRRDQYELVEVFCGRALASRVDPVVGFVRHDPLGRRIGGAAAAVGVAVAGAFLLPRLW